MDSKQKILVSGAVRGQFRALFTRVEKVNRGSGPFELLLCCGEFFGQNNDELEAFKNGNKLVPVPTFILGPNSQSEAKLFASITEDEICPNVMHLGKRGLYTTSAGIKIAYLSGTEGSSSSAEHFTREDVLAIRDSCLASKSSGDFRGVDVLLTFQAPEAAHEGQKDASKMISWLAKEIRPRYHFSGANLSHFERVPYRTPPDRHTQLDLSTRFISLAAVGNAEKAKYLYAASVVPVEKMRVIDLLQKTTDETPCPYLSLDFGVEKGPAGRPPDSNQQFFYDMTTDDGNRRHHGGESARKRQRRTIDQEKCWFCLSSPDVEKHLVITVGDNFYLALPKGPINEDHVLILSITHIQASALLSDSDWTELGRFKAALRKYFAARGKVAVFFERNYKSSHLMVDAVAVDAKDEWQIQHAFTDKAEEHGLQLETVPPIKEPTELPERGPYFIAELPNESTMITRQMKNFPLQFGRDVLCAPNLLDCEEKVDWRECKLEKEEEIEMVKRFRERFAPFDFAME